MEEALLEQLSAFADGELDAAAAAAVSAALERDPSLHKALAAIRRLDAAASALPVPNLDADTGRALWDEVAFRTIERKGDAPPIESSGWKAVGGALPAPPQVSDERWAKVWTGIRAGLDERTKPMPAVADTTSSRALPLDADFSPVGMSVVSETHGRPARRKAVSLWMAAGVMAAAAMILLATIPLMQSILPAPGAERDPTGDAMRNSPSSQETASVLDDKYFMLTRHTAEVEHPVVCFFLKEDETSVNEGK